MDLDKIMKETVLAVKIDSETNEFNFIKKDLDPMVQAGLEKFLEAYLDSCKKIRAENFDIEFLESEE